MVKLAVFDIDRTLVAPGVGYVAPETIAALKQLQQNGIKIAIASGRLFSFLQPELLEIGFDYYIVSNGAYVTDRTGTVLAQESVDDSVAEALLQEMIRRGLPIDVRYCAGKSTGNPACSVVQWMQDYWRIRNFVSRPPKTMLNEYIPQDGEHPISFSGYIPPEDQAHFIQMFPQLAFLPVFEGPLCDINPAHVSKATGLETVCRLSGVHMRDTIAFGDDRNDLELIQAAGIGVAMGNSIPAVKDAADYVTTTSEELGVLAALRHFGLID